MEEPSTVQPTAESPLQGAEAIRAALKTIPVMPGVYRMIAGGDRIIYIGKAKNLHARVSNYANVRDLSTRTIKMVSHVQRVEFTVTKSEAEALLVEANFVRKYRPHYNILLKDDKSFPSIRVDTTHPYPRIEKYRGAQNKPGEYFGPFASAGAVNETLGLLQRLFLLRPCADTIFKNRSRPCLQYQIKRCSAPCVKYVSEEQYREQLNRARDFLSGKARDVQNLLAEDMNKASEAMEYEKAALLRDQIKALTKVQQDQGMRVAGLVDADVIALARKGARSVMMVSFYRQGNHFGQQSFHPRHEVESTDEEVMAAFLAQFYQSHTPPPEVLLNHAPAEPELLSEALSLNVTYRVDLRVPQRGDKLNLIKEVEANARTALARVEMEQASVAQNLAGVQALFALPRLPERIEVYDNSHIMGTNAVGAFIVATPDGFDKRSYRTFTIKAAETIAGDDYGMMREVFRRRFKTTQSSAEKKEEDTKFSKPDLVLIDGGLGQLNVVLDALKERDTTGILFVAIAKGVDRNAGREWFHIEGREPFQMPINDPVLHYLQRLRDEAHRYAIGRHRNKRSNALTTSALDDIQGIGSMRKRALLQHFGGRAQVERATLAELEKVEGISKKTARTIYEYFRG